MIMFLSFEKISMQENSEHEVFLNDTEIFFSVKETSPDADLSEMFTNWEEGNFKPTFRNKIGTSKCSDMEVSYLWILIYNSLYLSEETKYNWQCSCNTKK